MKIYLKYGIIYVVLVLAINLAIDFSYMTVLNFLKVGAIVCLPALVISWLCKLVPKSLYKPNGIFFKEKKKENRFYEKLNIRKWKSKVPEFGKFDKSHMSSSRDPEYLRRFIWESCLAEAIHTLSICWGIISLIFVDKPLILCMGVPLVFFNVLVHIFPVMIQRYVRPKLMRTLERVLRSEESKKQAPEMVITPAEPLEEHIPENDKTIIDVAMDSSLITKDILQDTSSNAENIDPDLIEKPN